MLAIGCATSIRKQSTSACAAFPEERIRRGVALTGFAEDHDGVTAHLADGSEVRGDVLIAADGESGDRKSTRLNSSHT